MGLCASTVGRRRTDYFAMGKVVIRFDESMTVQKGMNITCHPTYLTKRLYGNITDNYFIGETGVVERVHKFTEQLVEIM